LNLNSSITYLNNNMSTRKRKQQEPASVQAPISNKGASPATAAGAPPAAGYSIMCSIKSSLEETDGDCFIDCYGEEVDDAQESAEDSATCRDGAWMWDSNPRAAAGAAALGFAGGSGKPVFFSAVGEANRVALDVWIGMIQSFACLCTPLVDQLQEQIKGGSAKKGSAATGKAGSKKQSSKSAAAAAAAAAAERKVLMGMFKPPVVTTTADGRVVYSAELQWYDDPWDSPQDPLKNVVCSALKVEVVAAELR
jgi:hypothetical protein